MRYLTILYQKKSFFSIVFNGFLLAFINFYTPIIKTQNLYRSKQRNIAEIYVI